MYQYEKLYSTPLALASPSLGGAHGDVCLTQKPNQSRGGHITASDAAPTKILFD